MANKYTLPHDFPHVPDWRQIVEAEVLSKFKNCVIQWDAEVSYTDTQLRFYVSTYVGEFVNFVHSSTCFDVNKIKEKPFRDEMRSVRYGISRRLEKHCFELGDA
ncbi:MAG: hypothetical protein ACYSWP_07080 [Planctomycetota bacterium]|jgi:hypothetical protein